MKIKDLFKNINKIKQFEEKIFIGNFAEKVFNLYIQNWDDQTRLISYYLANWHCTDTCVGYKVYFFDDTPVAISSQLGRKMTEEIEWVSKEDYKKVKDYIMLFSEELEDTPNIIDLEKDCDTEYKVHFYSQMYDHHKNNAIYNGDRVKIVNNKDSYNDGKYHPELVEIKFENGDKQWVTPDSLLFSLNLKN